LNAASFKILLLVRNTVVQQSNKLDSQSYNASEGLGLTAEDFGGEKIVKRSTDVTWNKGGFYRYKLGMSVGEYLAAVICYLTLVAMGPSIKSPSAGQVEMLEQKTQ
jgi:hypothetical protein